MLEPWAVWSDLWLGSLATKVPLPAHLPQLPPPPFCTTPPPPPPTISASLLLLPVWINVSPLKSWFVDFHILDFLMVLGSISFEVGCNSFYGWLHKEVKCVYQCFCLDRKSCCYILHFTNIFFAMSNLPLILSNVLFISDIMILISRSSTGFVKISFMLLLNILNLSSRFLDIWNIIIIIILMFLFYPLCHSWLCLL